MVHLICFVKRNPALSVAEFHHHWRTEHADRIRETPAARDRIVRYQQNHRAARDYDRSDCPYDGVAIQEFRAARDFFAMVADPEYRERVGPDEARLLDLENVRFLLTDSVEWVIPGDTSTTASTLFALLHRRRGTTPYEFHRHWRTVHGPLNRDTPELARHIVRYEQHRRAPRDYERAGEDADGVTIQWFRSARDFFAMAGEPAYRDVIAPDEARFLDRDRLVWLLSDPAEVVIG